VSSLSFHSKFQIFSVSRFIDFNIIICFFQKSPQGTPLLTRTVKSNSSPILFFFFFSFSLFECHVGTLVGTSVSITYPVLVFGQSLLWYDYSNCLAVETPNRAPKHDTVIHPIPMTSDISKEPVRTNNEQSRTKTDSHTTTAKKQGNMIRRILQSKTSQNCKRIANYIIRHK